VKLSVLIVLILGGSWSWAQNETPDLTDSVLFCNGGAIPVYIPGIDSTGSYELFHENGTLKAKGKITRKQRHGLWTSFYRNGEKRSEGLMNMGSPYGVWTFYYDNGKVKAKGIIDNGKFELGCAGSGNFMKVLIRVGSWSFYTDDGSVILSCHFIKNKSKEEVLGGVYTSYFTNGKKKESGQYKLGQKFGHWTYYHNSGVKKREEFYLYKDCGLYDYNWYECPSGTWMYYDENGDPFKKQIYSEGLMQEEVMLKPNR